MFLYNCSLSGKITFNALCCRGVISVGSTSITLYNVSASATTSGCSNTLPISPAPSLIAIRLLARAEEVDDRITAAIEGVRPAGKGLPALAANLKSRKLMSPNVPPGVIALNNFSPYFELTILRRDPVNPVASPLDKRPVKGSFNRLPNIVKP